MVLSSADQAKISQLSNMLDELYSILEALGEDTVHGYRSLRKVRNALKAKDPRGISNVKKHLMMDFRMIEDRQLDELSLNRIVDCIYHYVNGNSIFVADNSSKH